MRVLALGDVVGGCGCEKLRTSLPELKKRYSADLTVVNGENSSESIGISRDTAAALFRSGADVITTGNHVWRHRDIFDELDRGAGVIRPANYHPDAPGSGCFRFEKGRLRALIINLAGQLFMDAPYESPFACAERLLAKNDCKAVLIDFHAEATSEKQTLGWLLDGRVSLVFGTHTHVQTADERILPGGTGYITDLGMCGARDSIIGMNTGVAMRRIITKIPEATRTATGEGMINGVFAEIDETTGKTVRIERINLR